MAPIFVVVLESKWVGHTGAPFMGGAKLLERDDIGNFADV